jgi:hypothetical protein
MGVGQNIPHVDFYEASVRNIRYFKGIPKLGGIDSFANIITAWDTAYIPLVIYPGPLKCDAERDLLIKHNAESGSYFGNSY